ncbi:MAG: transposase, partial [Chloroflexota bacterium]|nr:transposase [Chloroflexota bacterium]
MSLQQAYVFALLIKTRLMEKKMAEEADDLLLYGVAAAESGSKDEARFYLEWALRAQPNSEQEAKAWYWLSRVTDDPVEKRSALENVLAAYPTYPEARRDLAILEGRLNEADIIDQRRPIASIAPPANIGTQDEAHFTCPRCGAKMVYDSLKEIFACQFCGYKGDATQQSTEVQERDWVAAVYTQRGHRWELPTARMLYCLNCGANVALAPSRISTACPFCGTPYVEHAIEERELIEPEGIIPFSSTAQWALDAIQQWSDGQSLRQPEIRQVIRPVVPRPVYLPFWTF